MGSYLSTKPGQYPEHMRAIAFVVVGVSCYAYAAASLAKGLTKLPYTGIEASYGQTEFDDISVDADGFHLIGFYDVGSDVFVSGGYASAETDEFTVLGVRGSIKGSGFNVGLGYHHALNPTIDIVPSVSLIDATTEFQGGFSGVPDEDDTGWSAGVALRALITPQIEFAGGVDYTDLYDDDSTSFEVEGHFYPVDKLGLGLEYDVSDDTKTLSFVARVLFQAD